MAEQPPAQTPAENGSTSPAPGVRMAGEDDMIEVKVYGKTQLVPVKLARQDYQTSAAGRQAIEEAKRIRAEAHLDREHAERYRNIEIGLRRDPDGTIRNLERLAGVTRQEQSSEATEGAPREDPKTRDLTERLERMERVHNQDRLKSQNSRALDEFPLFRNDAKAREFAEKQILAYQVLDPQTDPLEAARDIHTDLIRVRGVDQTQTRDNRLANEQRMPNIPTNAGMPDLSDIPVGKAEDMRNGTFRQNLAKAMGRFRSMTTGQ